MSTSASRRRPSVPPRAYIEHVVAFLLDYLDQLDGDPDLEDDNEDCCEARDDRGTRHGPWGIPAYAVRRVA